MEIRQVVIHQPGPKWIKGMDFREQLGIKEHAEHYLKFRELGKLELGGPFIDSDAGGMMIASKEVNREELQKYAESDPAIQSGLLTFKVVTWYIAMTKDSASDKKQG